MIRLIDYRNESGHDNRLLSYVCASLESGLFSLA
jgi:hypothetical protein